MRRILALPLLLALLALLAAGCGGGSGSSTTGNGGNNGSADLASGDVAVVGTSHITKAKFDALIAQAQRSYNLQKRTFPKAGSTEYKTLQSQAIQFLVQREEYNQKAQQLGVTVTDQQVQDRLKQIKKQYFGGSESRYKAQLKTQGLTDTQVQEDVRSQLISEGLFKKVTANVKVSDTQAKNYYDLHKTQYTTPETRDVRHILVKTKQLADKLYSQLKAGGDFAKLAKKYSQDPGSKANGGKLTISKGQTVKEFDALAFKLKTNELGKPVHTQYGWHIIQALSAIKPSKVTPFKSTSATIKSQLEQQQKTTAMSTWVTSLKAEFTKKIKYAPGYEPVPTTTATTTPTSTT